MKVLRIIAAVALGLALLGSQAIAMNAARGSGPDFGHWAVLLVSGDNRAHSGAPSHVFDNARHDLAKAFAKMGFSPANMEQFAIEDHGAHPAEIASIAQTFRDLARRAPAGCLIYFTSHGAPRGIVVGDDLISPRTIARIVDGVCGKKPAVVVMSACYSGQFVGPLAAPNRIILTASRADRASFGCGEMDRYTYFDDCFLRAIPYADDFASLGGQVQGCVREMEEETGATPPSQPQLRVGPDVVFTLRYK